MQILKSYSSPEFNTFEVIVDEQVIAYYYEHFVHPATEEKLASPVFEIYYDFDGEDYESSVVSEDFDDIQDIIDSF